MFQFSLLVLPVELINKDLRWTNMEIMGMLKVMKLEEELDKSNS